MGKCDAEFGLNWHCGKPVPGTWYRYRYTETRDLMHRNLIAILALGEKSWPNQTPNADMCTGAFDSIFFPAGLWTSAVPGTRYNCNHLIRLVLCICNRTGPTAGPRARGSLACPQQNRITKGFFVGEVQTLPGTALRSENRIAGQVEDVPEGLHRRHCLPAGGSGLRARGVCPGPGALSPPPYTRTSTGLVSRAQAQRRARLPGR